jgi:hypothetical protein
VFALRPEPAAALAALRIVVPAVLLFAPGFHHGALVAAYPASTHLAAASR